MGDQLLDLGSVYLARFCGPASAGDRRCYQIDGPERLHGSAARLLNVCLTTDQAEQVAKAILHDLGFMVIAPPPPPKSPELRRASEARAGRSVSRG